VDALIVNRADDREFFYCANSGQAGCPTFRDFRNVGFHGPVILGIFLTSNKKAPLTRAGPFKLTAKSQQLTAVLSTYLPCRRRVRRRRPELSSLPESRLPALPLVSISDEIEPALVSAVRTTFVGSSTPAFTRSSIVAGQRVVPEVVVLRVVDLAQHPRAFFSFISVSASRFRAPRPP
jgi:hypothetical protein